VSFIWATFFVILIELTRWFVAISNCSIGSSPFWDGAPLVRPRRDTHPLPYLGEIPEFPNFTHFLVVVAAEKNEKNLEKKFPSFPGKTQMHIDFPSIAPHHRFVRMNRKFRRFFPLC
jgi:hypothetical protein